MRFVWLSLMAALFTVGVAACGSNDGNGNPDGGNGDGGGLLPCEGIGCKIVQCPNNGTTSISGTVFAPNGTLPIYNATVYVPLREVGPLPTGASCDRCSNLLGEPLVRTTTNEKGEFTLTNVPATTDVPVVVQIGKWRKKLTIPAVPPCENTPLDAGMTRLPKNKTEGDIPQMAISTGGVDALECLLRKVGLDDSEFTVPGDGGRVHMFAGYQGVFRFDQAHGGKMFPAPQTSLWNTEENLSKYDVVFLSCEGSQNLGNKPPEARSAMKSYADKGGRVFASHWHNAWLQEGPTVWRSAFEFHPADDELPDLGEVYADIDTTFPTSMPLTAWLGNQNALENGKIKLVNAQHSLFSVETDKVERWIHIPQTTNNRPSVQFSSIVTPIETSDQTQKCGRMVLSDIHVPREAQSERTSLFYPGIAGTVPDNRACRADLTDLTPQEKVLAFMVFDIAACVGDPIE
jgi:hypothetical protein